MVSLLERPTYSLAEAARLLRVSPSRLRWWLEGAVRGEKRYPPVLRGEPTGNSQVSWGEFIEAAYLREYRAHLPLQRLRPLREVLSREFKTRFPFAVSKPLIAGRDLVSDMQVKLKIPEELWMVVGSGQLMLSTAAQTFCGRVQFDPATEEAMRYIVMPAEEPVYVDPRHSFGIPTVRGIRTEVITELSLAASHARRLSTSTRTTALPSRTSARHSTLRQGISGLREGTAGAAPTGAARRAYPVLLRRERSGYRQGHGYHQSTEPAVTGHWLLDTARNRCRVLLGCLGRRRA